MNSVNWASGIYRLTWILSFVCAALAAWYYAVYWHALGLLAAPAGFVAVWMAYFAVKWVVSGFARRHR